METHFLTVLVSCTLFSIGAFSQTHASAFPRSTGQSIGESKGKSTVKSKSEGIYATIDNPRDGNEFKGAFPLNGVAKNIHANDHLWLVVCPRESVGCWPQFKEIKPNKKAEVWNGKVEITTANNGTLIDIVLVCANVEANKSFNSYVINQLKEKEYPAVPMPEGARPLAHITVIKALKDNISSNKVNVNYGFSKTGVFYIRKSLITQISGEPPCLAADITNWINAKMVLDGDYYIYETNIERPYDANLEYRFYIGNGMYIPQILLEKSPSSISKNDCKKNSSNGILNFYTPPQDYYPSSHD
jgi:hypothetical protein